MDKASKALKRSSVRLKSLSGGHGNLRMVIAQLRDVRSSAKAFMHVQTTASEDLVKWASKNENQAIQDTFAQLFELNTLWAEVQKEFTESLKGFIHQFELILEGEQHVDVGRNHLQAIEQREQKLEKDLVKAQRRHIPGADVNHIQRKLAEEKQAKQVAQQEVMTRIQENEAVKMIRVKEGLLQLSESYLQLARKCHVVFEAHRDVAQQIPDAQNRNIHEIQYEGCVAAQQSVTRAREQLRQGTPNRVQPCAPIPDEPPPPYSASQSPVVGSAHTSMELRYSSSPSTLVEGADVRWSAGYEDEVAGSMEKLKT
ncbi:hypothetical protein R5R35_002433 [Gryllus longicercus]|uniref:Uncharacterized protein n=1 Tax=Gryllus longicercus TaxID=2509291 RepID=A0AAN9V5F1_9ORTH